MMNGVSANQGVVGLSKRRKVMWPVTEEEYDKMNKWRTEPEEEEEKLLPCPFCGSDAVAGWVDQKTYEAGCSEECECYFEGKTPEEAVKKWNTRV